MIFDEFIEIFIFSFVRGGLLRDIFLLDVSGVMYFEGKMFLSLFRIFLVYEKFFECGVLLL